MPEDNWWTEPLHVELTGEEGELEPLVRCRRRIDYYLSNYEERFSRHYYADNVSIEVRDGVGGLGSGQPVQSGFAEDIDTKADLDRAIKLLPPRQRKAVELCRVGTERQWYCPNENLKGHDLRARNSDLLLWRPDQAGKPPPTCPHCKRPLQVHTARLLERQAGQVMGISPATVNRALEEGLETMTRILGGE
jgi:hypothetical protein